MRDLLHKLLQRFHAGQSGAVALLCLAAILILFMCALVIYDAGLAGQDKLDAQIGADSAVYSHTVVKARTMNLIAFANTIKRMAFSYLATYINAWLAILARWAYHASRCFRIFPDISSCITWALAIPMIISEGIEMVVTNFPSTGAWPIWMSDNSRVRSEFLGLEQYTQYMFAITPWWAYVEGAFRGMKNGALITAAWPPPGASLSQVNSAISGFMGPAVMSRVSSGTPHTDVLPISRRNHDEDWNNVGDAYDYGDYSSSFFGEASDYCWEWWLSMEWLVAGAQTYWTGRGTDPDGWENWFVASHILPISVGCVFAAFTYADNPYMDWKIKEQYGTWQEWNAATSVMHISYTPRAGRNDNANMRGKYTYISWAEANLSNQYRNEGYFGLARSELVYKQPFEVFNTINDVISRVPILGSLLADRTLGMNRYPDMWSPRWKAKNRPVVLPNENGFGSAIQPSTQFVDFGRVTRDVVPFLALGSVVGLGIPLGADPPFSVGSAARDFGYLMTSASTLAGSTLQAITK